MNIKKWVVQKEQEMLVPPGKATGQLYLYSETSETQSQLFLWQLFKNEFEKFHEYCTMHFLQIRAVLMALFMMDMLFVLSSMVATSHEATEPLKKG